MGRRAPTLPTNSLSQRCGCGRSLQSLDCLEYCQQTSAQGRLNQNLLWQGDGAKLSEKSIDNVNKALNGLLGGQKLGKRPMVGAAKASTKNKALLYSLLGTRQPHYAQYLLLCCGCYGCLPPEWV